MAVFFSLLCQSLLCLSLGCKYKSVSGQIRIDRSGRSPEMRTGCTLQRHKPSSQIKNFPISFIFTVFSILFLVLTMSKRHSTRQITLDENSSSSKIFLFCV